MELRTHTEEAKRSLDKALKAYQKKSKQYAKLCEAKKKYQKREKDKKLDKINAKIQTVEMELIKRRIALDKAKKQVGGHHYSRPVAAIR